MVPEVKFEIANPANFDVHYLVIIWYSNSKFFVLSYRTNIYENTSMHHPSQD